MFKQASFRINVEVLTGVAILFLFAFTYSYLAINVLDVHRPLKNSPNWQGAHWIKAGEISGSGYFRKHFNVSSLPHRAYFVVSGTDEFSVFLNGESAGTKRFFGARPSMILDITKLLRIGENLLAVKVTSDVQDTEPELIGRIVWASFGDQWQQILSDQSWLVSRQEAFQKVGGIDWKSQTYNDFHWKHADIILTKYLPSSLPLTVPEHVYKTFPKGYWIWSGNTDIAVLSNEFVLNGNEIQDAWLGVSTSGEYSLVVNGVPVISQQGQEKTMEIVNIAPYVQLGRNNIRLDVTNKALQPKVLVSASITTDHSKIELNSSDQWQTFIAPAPSKNIVEDMTVTVKSEVGSDLTHSNLSLIYKELESSGILSARRTLSLMTDSLIVLLISLVIFGLFYRLGRNDSKCTMAGCFSLFVRPFVLGLVIIVVSTLLRYDLRIDNYASYQFYTLLLVPVLVMLFEVIVLVEMRSRKNQ